MIEISYQQYLDLQGFEIAPNWFCNPKKDALGRYGIGVLEAEALNIDGPEFEFIPIPTDQPIPIM